jgi:hypothetical protein
VLPQGKTSTKLSRFSSFHFASQTFVVIFFVYVGYCHEANVVYVDGVEVCHHDYDD